MHLPMKKKIATTVGHGNPEIPIIADIAYPYSVGYLCIPIRPTNKNISDIVAIATIESLKHRSLRV